MNFIKMFFIFILILMLFSCSMILNKQPLEENSTDVATPSEISAVLDQEFANPAEIEKILSSNQ